MTEGKTLELSGELTATTIGRQWKQWLIEARSASRISLKSVTGIDSAGVAMVRCLQAEASRASGTRPALVELPARYEQICLAHRIEAGGN